MLEVTSIHSVAGILNDSIITYPPFRSPHHTSSYVAMVGGGSTPKPGEVTLAHRGVLFVDEFPEFEKRVIETLRQPLEDGIINISRAKASTCFPANFTLIAALNPCPCGNYGSDKECTCNTTKLLNYQRKLSGPIVDRIDTWVEVSSIDFKKLSKDSTENEKSSSILKRVIKARDIQRNRFNKNRIILNSKISVKNIEKFAKLNSKNKQLLNSCAKSLNLSPRSYHKIIKLARTIADLDTNTEIKEEHLLEAIQYRPKSQNSF